MTISITTGRVPLPKLLGLGLSDNFEFMCSVCGTLGVGVRMKTLPGVWQDGHHTIFFMMKKLAGGVLPPEGTPIYMMRFDSFGPNESGYAILYPGEDSISMQMKIIEPENHSFFIEMLRQEYSPISATAA